MANPRQLKAEGGPAPRAAPQAWDPRPGEPPRWYARFEVYRALGPHRTLENAFRTCAQAEGLAADRPGSIWYAVAHEWAWEARAGAWDAVEREQLRANEHERRFDARERRLAMVDQLLQAAFRVLALANLPDMTQAEAREWVPTARLLFRDLITAEAREFGVPDPQDPGQGAQTPVFTADDLRRAQVELEEWRAAGGREPAAQDGGQGGNPAQAQAAAPSRTPKQTLLVCVGADSALMVDLAALRAVKSATGLCFHRILDVTRDGFDAYLRRERSKGRPVELLHLAVHASHAGIHFGDGVVEGDWLSERLLGVRVMLLAGCEGDRVGDWLGVVPHVVTLAEEIAHEDAAALTQHFWCAIGRGLAPDAALDSALAHCAPVVSEYVIRHW